MLKAFKKRYSNKKEQEKYVKTWKNSNLSQQEFCAKYNIKYHTFRTWVSRYNKRFKEQNLEQNTKTILIKNKGRIIEIPYSKESLEIILNSK